MIGSPTGKIRAVRRVSRRAGGGGSPLAKRTAALAAFCALAVPALAQDVLRGHGGPVRALAINPQTRELISGSFDSTVIVWDLQRNLAKRVLRFHEGPVNAVAVLADGCLASGGEDRRIAIWCGAGTKPTAILEGHEGQLTSIGLLDRGRILVSGAFDGQVRAWDLPARSHARVLANARASVTSLAPSADGGGVVFAAADGSIVQARLGSQPGPAPTRLAVPVTVVKVAPDGEIVAVSADGHVRFLAPASGIAQSIVSAEIEIDGTPLSSMALTPDGSLIATAGLRGGIAIIDRVNRRVLHRLTGPGLPVWSLVFDADNRTLISGGADRTIRRWDAVAGIALTTNVPERDPVAEAVASGERGAVVFRACQACHTLSPDDGNRAGPTLHGIMGRKIGTARGYAYSDALPKLPIVWNRETIARLFEVGPNAYTPGTKMPEQTITDPADRAALVDWLARTTQEAPQPR